MLNYTRDGVKMENSGGIGIVIDAKFIQGVNYRIWVF